MASKVEIILQGTDNASGAINATKQALHGLSSAAENTGGVFGKMGGILQGALSFAAGGAITAGLGAIKDQIGGLVSGMVGGNAEFERYETQFKTLLGSVDAAKERLAQLTEFAAKTPFELPEVVKADKILQSFGLESEAAAKKFGFNAQQIRQIAGDTAAGTGAGFEEMSMLLGKFASGATGEALMRMAELGIVTRDQLKEMGLQFSKSGELLSPLPQAMNTVLTAMQSKFGGLMEAQSSTFEGMVSNLQDWIGQTERAIGKPIFDVLKGSLGGLLNILNSDAVKSGIDNLAKGIAGGLQSAIDTVSSFGGKIAGLVQSVQTGLAAGPGLATVNLLTALGVPEDAAGVIGAKVGEIAGAISAAKGRIDAAIQSIQGGFATGGAGGGVSAILAAVGIDPGVAEQVGSQVQGVVDGVKSRVQAAVGGFWSGLATGGAGGAVSAFLAALGLDSGIAEAVGGVVQGVVDNVKSRVQAAFQGVSDLAAGNVGAADADWLKVFGVPEGLADMIGGKVQGAVDGAKARVQGAIASFQEGFASGGVAGGTSSLLSALGIPDDLAGQIGAKVAGIPAALNEAKARIQAAIAGFQTGMAAGPGVATINVLTALGIPDDIAGQIGAKVAGIPAALNEAKQRIQQAIQGFQSGIAAGPGVATINVLMALGIPEDTAAQIGAKVASIAQGLTDAKQKIQTAIQAFQSGFASGGVAGGASSLLSALGLDPSIVTTVQTVAGQIASAVSGAISTIRSAIAGFQSGGVSGLVAALGLDPGPIQAAITVVTGLFDRLKSGLAGFFSEIAPAAGPLKQLFSEMGALVAPAVSALQQLAAVVGGVLVVAFVGLMGYVGGALPGLGQIVRGAVEIAVGALEILIGAVRLVGTVVSAVLTGDWSGAWDGAKASVQTMVNGVQTLLDGLKDTAVGAIRAMIDGLVSAITGGQKDATAAAQGIAKGVIGTLTGMAQEATRAGAALLEAFASGIRSAISAPVAAVQGALGQVAAMLPHSDAETGPLSNLTASGASLFPAFAAGIQSTSNVAVDAVRNAMTQIAAQLKGGNVTDALHQIASLFRQTFNAFSGASDGIGGNGVNHVRRLIDSVAAISGAIGDFVGMLNDLQKFASSAAGQAAATEGGSAGLVWMFTVVAQLGQRMAIAARQAAEGFIDNDVRGNVQALASYVQGLGALVKGVVDAVTIVVNDVGGTGIENVLNWAEAQQWIINLVGGLSGFATRLVTAAAAAAAGMPAADAGLTNLSNAMQPLSDTISTTVGMLALVLKSVGGTDIEAVLQSSEAEQWISNLISGLVMFASMIKTQAEAAAGKIPPASASLTNLANALQPLTTIVSSMTSLITSLDETLGNSVIQGATTGPMAGLWQALYAFIAVGLVGFVVGLKAAVEAALGSVPDASKALQNLSNAIAPITTVIEGTVTIIKDLDAWLKAPVPLTDDMTAAARTLAENLKALWMAVKDALTSGAPTDAELKPAQAWASTMGVVTSLSSLMDFLKKLADFTQDPVDLSQDMRNRFVTLGQNLKSLWADLQTALDGASPPTEAAIKAAQDWASTAGPITGLAGLMDFLKKLADFTQEPVDLSQDMRGRFVMLGQNLKDLWADLQTALDGAAPPTGEAIKAAQTWASAAGPVTSLAGLMDFLKKLADFTQDPVDLSQDMRNRFIALGDNLKSLWADLELALNEATPPTSDDLKAAQAWTSAAGPVTALAGLMDFLAKLADFTKDPTYLTTGMRVQLYSLGVELKALWADLTLALNNAEPPSQDAIKAAQTWTSVASPITAVGGLMDFLTKLDEWAQKPVALSQPMRSTFVDLGKALKDLWADMAAALGTEGEPTEAQIKIAETWQKAAGLLDPLQRVMDTLKALDEWTTKPVAYSSQIKAQVGSLMVALKDITQQFIAGAQEANIDKDMQAAADALSTVGGQGMDALQKAMSTIKSLFEFKIENGPGWLQQPGGNNIWTTGSSTPGIPDAAAIKDKVGQFIAAIKEIVAQMQAGLGDISLGQDSAALTTKLASVLRIVSDAAELVKKMDELTGGGKASSASFSLAVAIAFDIPDVNAEIAKIVATPLHVPIVWDIPPITAPAASGGGGGSTTTTYNVSNNYTYNTNNVSISQTVPAAAASATATTAMTALYGGSPV